MELFLNDKLGKISVEMDKAARPLGVLIIAHGAGAGMHHPFMATLSSNISDQDFHVVRFNFPYMEQGRKSPGSPKSNIETWNLVIDHIKTILPGLPLFISGKSYGGRMASHLIANSNDQGVRGIVYFGFPLHAPGKDSKDRASHLTDIRIPQLFLQGSKDKLANINLMNEVIDGLGSAKMKVVEHGDHSFNVPKKSGKTKEDVMKMLVDTSVEWMKSQID